MSAPFTRARPEIFLRNVLSSLSFFLAIVFAISANGDISSEGDSLAGPKRSSLLIQPAIAAISLYQKVLSPQQGQVCAFQPTCSQFAQEALRKYGLFQGALMASDRLQRCHYCAPGNYPPTKTGFCYDPVEDHRLWGDDPIIALSPLELESPFTPGATEEEDPLLAFAHHLCAQKDYHRAYAQFLAFSRIYPQDPRAVWARLRAGVCLEKMGRWPEAASHFEELASQKPGSCLAEESTFQLALLRYQNGDPLGSQETLATLKGTSRRHRATLMTGWIQLERGKTSQARASWEGVEPTAPAEVSQAAQAMLGKLAQEAYLPRRSASLAALFSTVVPGSGKWYAGKAMDGLYSFLLVGSTVAIAYAYEEDHQRAKALAFGAVGLFFHLGNIFGSAVEAKEYNRRARDTFLQELWTAGHPQRWLWDLGYFPGPGEPTAAQEGSLGLADQLFRQGQYGGAITEYKRHLFFSPKDTARGVICYKIGLAYLNEGKWDQARAQLRAEEIQSASSELRYRSRLRMAQSFIGQGLVEQARWSLRNFLRDPIVAEEKKRSAEVQYWLGTCALSSGEWVEAAGVFHLLEREHHGNALVNRAQRLAQAAREGFHLSRRSPTMATGLSAIFPGSGQIYCGRLWDGLLSLALNAAAGYVTIDAFRDDRQLDGFLLATMLWARFYLGGQRNAARYAREYNRRALENHLRPYRELMVPNYME